MSGTPRTDAACGVGNFIHCVDDDFARALERELNLLKEDREELIEEIKSLKETIRDQEHHIMELERLRRYSPGPHMGQD